MEWNPHLHDVAVALETAARLEHQVGTAVRVPASLRESATPAAGRAHPFHHRPVHLHAEGVHGTHERLPAVAEGAEKELHVVIGVDPVAIGERGLHAAGDRLRAHANVQIPVIRPWPPPQGRCRRCRARGRLRVHRRLRWFSRRQSRQRAPHGDSDLRAGLSVWLARRAVGDTARIARVDLLQPRTWLCAVQHALDAPQPVLRAVFARRRRRAVERRGVLGRTPQAPRPGGRRVARHRAVDRTEPRATAQLRGRALACRVPVPGRRRSAHRATHGRHGAESGRHRRGVSVCSAGRHYRDQNQAGVDHYSERCLARIWRAERFSWWLTALMHTFPDTDAFGHTIRAAELGYVVRSKAASTSLARHYVGLPLDLLNGARRSSSLDARASPRAPGLRAPHGFDE